MQIILSVILWIFLGLIGLFILALFLPVCVSVEVDYDKPKAWLKILFFKYQIYPMKEKTKKTKDKKPDTAKEHTDAKQTQAEKAQQEQQEPEQPKLKLPKLSLEKIIAMIKAGGTAIKIIFKGLYFTKIQIVYPVHDDDSAQAAILYGQTQAYFSGIAATLQNFVHLSFKSVSIIPDFTNEHKYRRYFYCNIWSCAFIILVAGIYALIKLKKENAI